MRTFASQSDRNSFRQPRHVGIRQLLQLQEHVCRAKTLARPLPGYDTYTGVYTSLLLSSECHGLGMLVGVDGELDINLFQAHG